jgi:cell division protein FtsI (penicillin-binding protein 3)
VSIDVPSVSVDAVELLRGIDSRAEQESKLHEAANRLASVLSLDAGEVYGKLATRHRFVWVKRRVTGAEAEAVRDLGDPRKQVAPIHGVAVEGEGHRYYPGRELAGPLLGFVAPDGRGKEGIELVADEDLRGTVEELRGLRDRGGRLIFEGASDESSLQGHDVILAIDEGIQHIAEHELDAAMRTYETKGAALAVVEPFTGEIFALASEPGYNPNDYEVSAPDSRRSRFATDRFEPGSVMKPFLIAGALAAGTLKPTDSIDCERGVFQIGGMTIHDTHSNDLLTPTQILARSSNIGALKIGLKLGESALFATYRRFGFGEPSGLPVPGEASGLLRPKARPWYDAETASASFGQGISVTTVQLAMAMAALANGGKLLEPILIKRVVDSKADTVRETSTRERREVVSPFVARTVADMLTAVTEEGGTAVEAGIEGFRVAGKTSTAQKVDPATGKYSTDKFTAVFVGFVPVDHPRLVVAVVLDEPMIGRYGGDLAGPVFRRVSEASLRYLGVTPASGAAKLITPKRDGDAPSPAASPPAPSPGAGRAPAIGPTWVAEIGSSAHAGALANVATVPPGSVMVPDATGLAAHDVVAALSKAGLLPQIEGWGRAVRQNPPAGSSTPKGSPVRVVLEPAS